VKRKKFVCRREGCSRQKCDTPGCPFDTKPDHNYRVLEWYHLVPDQQLQDINWALEVARGDSQENFLWRLYITIQLELSRRGMTTSLGTKWLNDWQKKQNQVDKPVGQHFGYDRKSNIPRVKK
jgi:hypothetical protein